MGTRKAPQKPGLNMTAKTGFPGLRKIVFRLQRFELRMVQVHRIAQQRPIALPVQGLWTVPRPSDGELSISRLFVYPDRHEPA